MYLFRHKKTRRMAGKKEMAAFLLKKLVCFHNTDKVPV
jgi:hypothetical protein